jgi:hypothetical protein
MQNNKPKFKRDGLPLIGLGGEGALGLLSEVKDDDVDETISDSEISIFSKFRYAPPNNGAGQGTLTLNRYTGKVLVRDSFIFANKKVADFPVIQGEYSCIKLDKKLF